MEKLLGQQIGRYRLLEPLGQGGMALVYRAQDVRLERIVAFKILLPGYQHSDTFLKRFEREAKALAQLMHPNIVPLLDYGDIEGMPYLVMTYLPGGSIKSMMGYANPAGKAAQLLVPVADALGYAHRRGVIHRDVKPANILFTESGQPMLTDFGIVKLLESKDVESLTGTGMGIGTPDYMAPEQAQGLPIDQRADIYSLGIVLYEMVTGRKPFEADTPMSLLFKHISEAVPPPRSILPGLPEVAEAVILKALAKKPEERYASMEDFKAAMEGLLAIKDDGIAIQADGIAIEDDGTRIAILPEQPGSVTEVAPQEWEAPPEIATELQPPTDSLEKIEPEAPHGELIQPAGDVTEVAESATQVSDLHATEIATPDKLPAVPPWEKEIILTEGEHQIETRVSIPADKTSVAPPFTAEPKIQPVKKKAKKIRWWVPTIIAVAGAVFITLGFFAIIKPLIEGQTPTPVPTSKEVIRPTQVVEPTKAEEVVAPPPPATPLTVVRTGEPSTFDPALSYDMEAWEVVGNVYETLITYQREQPTVYIPQLADEYGISPDGLTYTFHIRPGILFHNSAELTASDAAYSLQRGVLMGILNTPQYMLTRALMGQEIDDISKLIAPEGELVGDRAGLLQADPDQLRETCERVRQAISADNATGMLIIHLPQPWAPFLSLLAAPFSSIVDQDWAAAIGGWDGSCETWQNYYTPSVEENPLSYQANGTGPFRLEGWKPGSGFIHLVRNDAYWRTQPGWPDGPNGNAFFNEVNIRIVPDLNMRLDILRANEVDLVDFGWNEYGDADALVGELCIETDGGDGFNCQRQNDQPTRLYLARTSKYQPMIFFNFNIQTPEGNNPFIGSGRLDGNGIPVDFFTDFQVRYAFHSCFNFEEFNKAVFRGYGIRNPTIALPGMMGYDPGTPSYNFNLDECRQAFQDSGWRTEDGRSLWEAGFQLDIPFRVDRTDIRAAAEILAGNISSINPAFRVRAVEIGWEDYSTLNAESVLPIFVGRWLDDVYDPYYRYAPYLIWWYADRISLPDDLRAQYHELLLNAALEQNPAIRNDFFIKINWLIDEQALFIFTGFEREHIYASPRLSGYFYNPAYYGNYFYALRAE